MVERFKPPTPRIPAFSHPYCSIKINFDTISAIFTLIDIYTMHTKIEKNFEDTLNITVFRCDGSSTVFPACRKSISGGSKTIINLDGKEVIALVGGNCEKTRKYIQSEVDFSKKLRDLGLRSQHYQMAEVMIGENETCTPVLIMPSFQFLAEQGHQVRDQKNSKSSSGESLIFENQNNLVSEDHWRKILTPLIDDIYNYLINGFSFAGDSWNVIIEDTNETSDKKALKKSLLFSDLAQEIHFYFFDFGSDIIQPRNNKTLFCFLDTDGEISEESIARQVNEMKDKVLSLIVHTSLNEQEYTNLIRNKPEHYKPVFEKIWQEIAGTVVNKIKQMLENLPDEERLNQFATEDSKKNILYLRNLRQKTSELQREIAQMKAQKPHLMNGGQEINFPREIPPDNQNVSNPLTVEKLQGHNNPACTAEENSSCESAWDLNLSMQVLGGFLSVLGITAVAVAFVALNSVAFGITVALGIGAALTGIGIFAVGTYRNRQGDECEPSLLLVS